VIEGGTKGKKEKEEKNDGSWRGRENRIKLFP
jgi:hypothetical protein